MNPAWKIILMAALPIAELRLALPAAVLHYKYSYPWAYLFSVIGNLLPVPFILLFFPFCERTLRRWAVAERFFNWLFARTRRRGRLVERWAAAGLVLFVAIPLPVTGAWTGCVAAYLFGISNRKALAAIAGGVLIAGIIVSALTAIGVLGASTIHSYF